MPVNYKKKALRKFDDLVLLLMFATLCSEMLGPNPVFFY